MENNITQPILEENSESEQARMLECINTTLLSLGSRLKWKRPPIFIPEYNSLKGKKILIVEDILAIIENYIPEIIVATRGNATALYHKGQSFDQVADEIIQQHPDIVLMDYGLACGVDGPEVIKELLQKGFLGSVVGFSSEKGRNDLLIEAGAIGAIDKGGFDTTEVVKSLATLIL